MASWKEFLGSEGWCNLQYKMALVFMDKNSHVSYQYAMRSQTRDTFELDWIKLTLQNNQYFSLDNDGNQEYSDQMIVIRKEDETDKDFYKRSRKEMRAIASKTAYELMHRYHTQPQKVEEPSKGIVDSEYPWKLFLRKNGWATSGLKVLKGFDLENSVGVYYLEATENSLTFDFLMKDMRNYNGDLVIHKATEDDKDAFRVDRKENEVYSVFYFRALSELTQKVLDSKYARKEESESKGDEEVKSEKADETKEEAKPTVVHATA